MSKLARYGLPTGLGAAGLAAGSSARAEGRATAVSKAAASRGRNQYDL